MLLSEIIQQHIAANQTDKAIKVLLEYFADRHKDIYQECILYSARYKKLVQENRMGLLETSQFNLQFNQINYALLGLLDQVVDENQDTPLPEAKDRIVIPDSINPKALTIFISYSHKDIDHLERLNVHFAPLRDYHNIVSWDDQRIKPGDQWESEIKKSFQGAGIVFVLVSADYLNSPYCKMELQWALDEKKLVIPILLEPCLWQETPIKNIQVLPQGAKPITLWDNIEEAYANVAAGIRSLIGT